MFGVLLIDKPQGLTSHDVVNSVRRKFKTRRVGHSGTLDPLGTGLLVVAVGPATRFLQYLPLEPKVYRFTVQFGIETDTYDAEGAVVAEKAVPSELGDLLPRKLGRFTGQIRQRPPAHSAVKLNGRPLYRYAREGIAVESRERTVCVERFDIIGSELDESEFEVVCSGGTYIRSLAHDLGLELGCGAHLRALRRLSVGRFSVNDAHSVADSTEADLISLAEALRPMKQIELDDAQIASIRNGRAIESVALLEATRVALLGKSMEVVGIAKVDGSLLLPECVIPVVAHVTIL